MQRLLYQKLKLWKENNSRKPLLLQGARQVGKTYLLEEFGKKEFVNYHLFNFEKFPQYSSIFEPDLNPDRILSELSLAIGKPIDPQTDLIIFDEIQECPKAINSLKYFNEVEENLFVCCAGSLLGVSLSSESFPVGKVDFAHLYPLNFQEFLAATEEQLLIDLWHKSFKEKTIPQIGHTKLWELLKDYYVTGGMPEAVYAYQHQRQNLPQAFAEVRAIQQNLITAYFRDITKHAGKVNAVHIASVFENVPMQLAHHREGSVNRYRFKDVIPKKKGFQDLRGPIDWLEKAGLIIKIPVCNRAEIPLEMFCKPNLFKLFLFDIGLLGAMLQIPPGVIYTDDYGSAKGYFAENLVAQQLISSGTSPLYSWTERNSEIEFVTTRDNTILPIEVKAGTRTRAKSLQQYIKKYNPGKALILSARLPEKSLDSVVHYLPLYYAGLL
jgi:predicted AAA+ superfamily ATPase